MASEYDFPRRAPIQFWMMSTFGLFVGIAVVIVGLYASVVLQNRVEREASRALVQRTRDLVEILERPMHADQRNDLLRRLSRFTKLRLTVWDGDSLLLDVRDGHVLQPVDESAPAEEMFEATARWSAIAFEDPGTENAVLFAAMRIPGTDSSVRVGQTNPAIYRVSNRMQATLWAGLVFALVLAVLGGWIAAIRVAEPIRTLGRIAQRINEGELNEMIAVETRASEFQDLAANLDRMADRFRVDIDKLQRLIRIQNEFLGNISHEVRNPIFAINGFLEALASPDLTREQRLRYARKGVENLDRLTTLFSDLIEIARLEYREDLIHPESFDIVDLVEEVVETARPKAEEKNLTLGMDVEQLQVYADRSRIRQVLTNLIENSIAYTDSGGVTLGVSREEDRTRIDIEDTGKGIDAEHLERIFDRFYRVDAARSRKYGGSGLGLSIVKQILHAHGQPIHVESEPGEGTRFWFELPLGVRMIEVAEDL